MALTQISFPAEEASDWTDFIDMMKDMILGYIRCSLTEWATGTVPQLAAGSKVELNGVYYTAGSNESITGSPSSGYVNYIYLDSAAYTLSWSTTPPTWNDAKQGWYNGADRWVGSCYYDGANFKMKIVDRGLGPDQQTTPLKTMRVPLTGSVSGSSDLGEVAETGNNLVFASTITTSRARDMALSFPDVAEIIKLEVWTTTITAGGSTPVIDVTISRSDNTISADDLAVVSLGATDSGGSDTSISNGVIDNDTYCYYLECKAAQLNAAERIYGVEITYLTREGS